MDYLILGLVYLIIHLVRAANMGIFYPLMRKAGYGLPPRDGVVVWWGAFRGAIGLALALVVYSEQLRFEFDVKDGGSGYNEATTSIVLLDKKEADLWERNIEQAKANDKKVSWHKLSALKSIATPTVEGGKIVGGDPKPTNKRPSCSVKSKTETEKSSKKQRPLRVLTN